MTYPFTENDAGRSRSKRPKQDNDCTVRATALVFDIPYDRAYEILRFNGRKSSKGYHYDELAEVLEVEGKRLKWTGLRPIKGQKRMNAAKFIEQNPTGKHIMSTTEHVFAVIDGVGYDTTQDLRCIHGFWTLVE